MNDEAEGPLAGIRVVEFATMVAGPMCGQILADLGAEVIKVEPPGGDMLRAIRPRHQGLSAMFAQFNRGKRSIVLDLADADDREKARGLATAADVVIENFRPGAMARRGLDHATLASDNPGLIYLSITGFGHDGPYARRRGYDQIIQGLTGFMPVQGRGAGPEAVRSVVADKATAMAAANGVMAALFARGRDGAGRQVSVSLLDAYAAFMLPDRITRATFGAADAETVAEYDIFNVVETADGHAIGYVIQDDEFRGLCRLFNRPDLIADARYATPAARILNLRLLWDAIAPQARQWTTAALADAAATHGVPLGAVNDIAGFFADKQVRHQGTWYDQADPAVGPIRQIASPVRFDGLRPPTGNRAPLLDEQRSAILSPTHPSRCEPVVTTVVGALRARRSVRAFLPDAIAEADLRDMLALAALAPSGGNLQPWHVHILSGAKLAALADDVERAVAQGEGPSGRPVYAAEVGEPYLSRRRACGEALYAAIGVPREDRAGRRAQFLRNARFFDAPVGLVFTLGEEMVRSQWIDLGLFMQAFMLVAVERGLGTCAQAYWAMWSESVARVIDLPIGRVVAAGMALGRPDPAAPVNTARTTRADVDTFATFEGFN